MAVSRSFESKEPLSIAHHSSASGTNRESKGLQAIPSAIFINIIFACLKFTDCLILFSVAPYLRSYSEKYQLKLDMPVLLENYHAQLISEGKKMPKYFIAKPPTHTTFFSLLKRRGHLDSVRSTIVRDTASFRILGEKKDLVSATAQATATAASAYGTYTGISYVCASSSSLSCSSLAVGAGSACGIVGTFLCLIRLCVNINNCVELTPASGYDMLENVPSGRRVNTAYENRETLAIFACSPGSGDACVESVTSPSVRPILSNTHTRDSLSLFGFDHPHWTGFYYPKVSYTEYMTALDWAIAAADKNIKRYQDVMENKHRRV